jgi:hypothetical protein
LRWLGTDGVVETEARRGSGGLLEGGSSGGVDKWHGVHFIGARVRAMRSRAEHVSASHDRAVACMCALGSEVALARRQCP